MNNSSIEQIAVRLRSKKSVLIFAHENPDGDAIGSCAAAGLALKKLGIAVDYAVDKKAKNYNDLIEEMKNFQAVTRSVYDAALILDCSTSDYIDNKELLNICKEKILIDHHLTNTGFADFCCICPDAAATGEIIFELLEYLKIKVTCEIAKALYLALFEDTGGFTHSNTTACTHFIVSKLYEVEPSLYEITQWLNYYDKTRLELMKLALDNMKFYNNSRVCIIVFTYQNGYYPYREENTEKLIDLGKHVKGCLLAAFIRQTGDDTYKVSLRSASDEIDIAEFSKTYGGGGHIRAAGFTFRGDLDQIVNKLISFGEIL